MANMIGTLAKVAMGVMVARGVGKLVRGQGAGGGGTLSGGNQPAGGGIGGADGVGGLSRSSGSSRAPNTQGGILGDILRGAEGSQPGGPSMNAGSGSSAGGLGGLLGDILKGAGAKPPGATTPARPAQPAQRNDAGLGGLGGLLGGILSGGAGKSGGLGGLLESLGGKRPQTQPRAQPQAAPGGCDTGQSAAPSMGGLGDLLNQAFGGKAAVQATQEQDSQAEIILRGMINAAKSDGQFDRDEQESILKHLGDATKEEIDFVRNEMAQPLDVDGFIRSVPRGLEQQVYLMSLLGIRLDSQAEAQYLHQLAQGLNISPEAANSIHQQVGVPSLYS